ncbi:MAG: hypothetical protein L6Q97_14240 [Thermoanaerobaculia bacterium]|nr:hypothetical protein [Thermoanaerobaculia bacterium]
MNYFNYESESLFGNGTESEFTDYDENYFREVYLENLEEEALALSFEEMAEAQGADDLRRRQQVAKSSGKGYVSAASFQRTIRRVYAELQKMSKLIRASNYTGNRVALLRKIKELEDSLSGVRNSQMLAAVLGLPNVESLTFDDTTLGKKTVSDTEYEFSINQLLPYLLNNNKGLSFDANNPLMLLLLSPAFSKGFTAGGQNNFMQMFLLFSLFNRK